MSEFNWHLTEFEEIVEYVAEMVGSDFMKVINLANDFLENPSEYTGVQAAMLASKISFYRTRIGVMGSYMKYKSSQTKKPSDRMTKDALLTIYDALVENINTLKLLARHEKEMVYGH